MNNAQPTVIADLNTLHYYLMLAYEVANEKINPIQVGVYPPLAGSEKKVCMLWAVWMTEIDPTVTTKAKGESVMNRLRFALEQVRDHEAKVDLTERVVYLTTHPDIINFR